MEHEFSHDPIKIRHVDIKTGKWKKSYVYIGYVPSDIERELIKVEKLHAANKTISSTKLKKFYGKNYLYRLGLIKDTKKGGDPDDPDPTQSIADELGLGVDLGIEITDEDVSPDTDEIEVTADDVIDNADEKQVQNVDVLMSKKEKTEKIEKKGTLEFVFAHQMYPSDNIIDLKNKITLVTGIPLYRQHVWYKYKDKSYPAQYTMSVFKNSINIDIESLISFYLGKKELDEIEGIPVQIDFYKNKDYIHVKALDTFHLLYTNYHKYGITEYFVSDMNDLVDRSHIYSKLKNDRYQLEVIYYGMIMLYFPMVTYTVFLDYLKNENNVKDIYPELYPDKSFLRRKYELMGEITDEAYQAQDDSKHIQKKLSSSITRTVVSIRNYAQDIDILVVLRNIFDIIELSPTITYCKTNLIHDGKNVMLKKAYMNEREPKDKIPINSLLIKIKTAADTNEHMKLIIFKNGNYIVRTNWREENHMDFNKITKLVASKVNPIIQMINKMGNRVKHYSINLSLIEKKNIQFTETGFVFYYDDDITEAHFNVFKKALDDMEKAGVIVAKETVSISQEFFFRRGMYKFDASRIEKAITVDNYYENMSVSLVRQKWATIFERTRLFSVQNISSKLKISISGIRNDTENMFFYMYLIGLLHVYMRNSASIKHVSGDTIKNKTKKTLKALKLQDPVLYDFKKIYKSEVIYSKICQKPYQPVILNEKEYKQLSKEKRSRAVKYWNFTKEKEAWYSCPNPKFPYIKFIVKQHPKDFCIPCCKKIPMGENVNKKKQEIHKMCLDTHKYTGKKVSLTKGSHYIATYGKDIEVGRLSRLPEHTLEPLFFDTYSPGGGIDPECITSDGYYLFGVDQHTESVKYVGFLYCLVHALNMSVDGFLTDCKARILKDPNKFRTLMDGTASMYFADHKKLISEFYILQESTLEETNVPWNELFMSIAYYYYGVNTLIFSDQNKERIDMVLPKGLKTFEEMFPDTHQSLIVLKKKENYYPVYLLNTEVFKRTGIIESRLFLNESGLMTTIQAVVRRHFESSEYEKIKQNITLAVCKNFVSSTAGTQITGYYINYANLCYAVSIKFRGKDCYFPIRASHYSFDKSIKLLYAPYSEKESVNLDLLLRLYSSYNKWVDYESKKQGFDTVNVYPKVEPERWITIYGSTQVIGFVSKTVNYYCKTISLTTANKYEKLQIQYVMYNPLEINAMIYSVKNGNNRIGVTNDLHDQLQFNAYKYHLYELITLQLINVFNKQRNSNMRRKLLGIIARTNFDKNMDKLREFIRSGIDDPEDVQKVKNIIGRFLTQHHNRKVLIADVASTYFNFDKIGLEKMKRMEHKKVVKELHKLSKQFVVIGKLRKGFEFPNILMPCTTHKSQADYCKGKKFVVSKMELNDILEIIAHDITNPTKWKWLFHSAFVSRTVEFFTFIRRPFEVISVEFIRKH